MAQTSITQADRDALYAAIKTGALRVDYPGGGATTYRSLAEMQSILAQMDRTLDAAAGTTPTRRVKVYSVKDL